MTHFPDTSFLCALYRAQTNSSQADAYLKKLAGELNTSSLLLFEFRQAVHFQIYLHSKDQTKGYAEEEGNQMLEDMQSDLMEGVLTILRVDWGDVHYIGERLSKSYTRKEGFRFADILHVATALHLGVKEFLTFDVKQRELAKKEGMKVPF